MTSKALKDQLSKCLGSIFADENYGNLDAAWKILEQLKLTVGDDDLEAKADLFDDYINFYLLTGKLNEAYRCLEECRAWLDQLAPRWRLIYAMNKCLVDNYRRHPPVLCFSLPDDLDALRAVSPPVRILGHEEILMEVDEWLSSCQEYELPSEKFICVIVKRLASSPLTYRAARHRHPLACSITAIVDSRPPNEIVAEIAPLHVQLQQSFIQDDANLLNLYVDRILLRIHYAMGSSACEDTSNRLLVRYEAHGDKVGMANCKLLQADAMLSSPFTAPILLNLMPLTLPSATEIGDILRNEEEARCPLKPCAGAAQLYDKALELYREASAPRGQAAILLRQGCYLHAQATLVGPDHRTWGNLVQNASQKLEASLALFGTDEANSQVVKANQILLDCSRRNFSAHTKEKAVEIGNWGRKHQNELLSRTLGGFMMRFARREWGVYRRFEIALWAYECAECCLKALGDVVTSFAAILDRAIMHKELSNGPSALVLARTCEDMIDVAIQWYDEHLDMPVHPSLAEGCQRLLEFGRHDLISDFNNAVRLLYSRFRMRAQLTTWEQRYNALFLHATHQTAHTALSQADLPKGLSHPRTDISRNGYEDWRRFVDADIESHGSFIEGDVRGTERPFERYLDSTPDRQTTHTQPLFSVLACQRIGDRNRAREILDSFNDNEIIHSIQSLFPTPTRHQCNQWAHLALFQCVVAQDWNRGNRFLDYVLKKWPTFWIDSANQTSLQLAMDLSTTALIDLHNDRVNVAFRRLLDARQHIELGLKSVGDSDVRPGFLKPPRVIEVYLILAEICLLCSRKGLPRGILDCYDFGHPAVSWEEHALLFVEEARARSTLDALEKVMSKDTADERLIQTDSIYKRRAMIYLQSLHEPAPEQKKELQRLEAEDTFKEDSFESTYSRHTEHPPHPSELSFHIQDDQIVIEAAFCALGCTVFAITTKGIEATYQGIVRDIDMWRWAREAMRLLESIPETSTITGPSELQELRSGLSSVCKKIAEIIIDPFANIVRQKRHIIFSISQPLDAFPFSLLPFNNQPLIRHAAVSQTPSLTVLYHLMQQAPPKISLSMSIFAKSVRKRDSTSDDPDIADEDPLHWAAIEALQAANLFSTWPIESSSLSREAFRNHFRNSSPILHITTHGDLNRENPLLSWISLAEKFRVLDLTQIRSKANLVVFAACLSGLGYATAGSDILGFTHVILGTGCQAYLGGLMKIDDFASMMLMTMFYRNLKGHPHISLAENWRQAQLEFMQMDEQKATRFLQELEDRWDSVRSHEGNAESFYPHGKETLTWQKARLSQMDWTSPHLWAPFTLMGYGGLRFQA